MIHEYRADDITKHDEMTSYEARRLRNKTYSSDITSQCVTLMLRVKFHNNMNTVMSQKIKLLHVLGKQ